MSSASVFPKQERERWEAYLSAAYHAFILIVAKGAFIADTDEGGGAHVAVTDRTFAVAFIAETTDGDAGLLAAHY